MKGDHLRVVRSAVAVAVAVAVAASWMFSATARAGEPAPPRWRAAYQEARDHVDALDLEAAIAKLDAVLADAMTQGRAQDPALAPLLALQAAIMVALGVDEAESLAVLRRAVVLDYAVSAPIELRSAEFEALLAKAREGLPPPSPVLRVEPGPRVVGSDLGFDVEVPYPVSPEARLVVYWRRAAPSAGAYEAEPLERFGSAAWGHLSAAQHGDLSLEYFVVVFDDEQRELARSGSADAPHRLAGSIPTPAPSAQPSAPKPTAALPRVLLPVGIGFGFGLARGTAERSYAAMNPGASGYGIAEQACAMERWAAADRPLARDQAQFGERWAEIAASDPSVLPAPLATLTTAYDPNACAARESVSNRVALAPLQITPEIGVRVAPTVVVSVFARLQVVTADEVLSSSDPQGRWSEAFAEVRAPQPSGTAQGLQEPPFTYAVGAKVRAFVGDPSRRVRWFVGGFAGYGFARYRVPLPLSQDRNGNSVADASETGISGPRDAQGEVIPETCVAVWPYNGACAPGPGGEADRGLASGVRANTSASERRVDTVKIGPGFAGALFGLYFPWVKHFGLFAEIDVGVWFPDSTSLLVDLNVGPVLSF